MKNSAALWLPALLACLCLSAQPVEFNRDIRGILSDKCYTCHGPDAVAKKIPRRLDSLEAATAEIAGKRAVVAGDPARSELAIRISSTNAALRMPPVYSGAKLSEHEIGLMRRWIEQGAKWEKHWSFIPPRRPALPQVRNRAWARNGIDYFILERLEREGLQPSPEAARATLLRRASLDLTGLPPSPAEVETFLKDSSADAYEKAVDRLLASPRYGERMAARWLDAARYADTSGYQNDGERFMWRWRDWVIDAFNSNLPYDRFALEQIAGDMLPNAGLDQKIATGFNRNHRGNSEGGIIPEEYAVEYVVDRVETTATVFLGLTAGCARCHNHKYDPITQKEFYQLFAYFNNIPEHGRAMKYGNSQPYIAAPRPAEQREVEKLTRSLAAAEQAFAKLAPELEAAQRQWESSLGSSAADWTPHAGLSAHFPLGTEATGKAGDFGYLDKFAVSAWIQPESDRGAIITKVQDEEEGTGWGLWLRDGRIQVNLVQRWLDDAARVETKEKLAPGRRYHVAMTYDGSRFAGGIHVYVNGVRQPMTVLLDALNQSFKVRDPLRIGSGGGPAEKFRGSINEVRLYGRALAEDEAQALSVAATLTAIAAIPAARRAPLQSTKLRMAFLDHYAPAHIQHAAREAASARQRHRAYLDSLPTVMVMQERETPRDTFLLIRGAYDRPGDKVAPGIPAALPPLPPGAPNNRLGFARWLVDPSNPLTARVAVNRFWQMSFGTGLVKTVEDFGSQGEWPSHPALLDWLATEFVRTRWDVKAMQKLIVTSAAYRQSSAVTLELVQRDPDNRLLARGPRLRIPAETIRDQALYAAGLLVEKIGGPSVKPYQPAGLWKELSNDEYKADRGENLYRRSLYTFWRRTISPPFMSNFDAPTREACTVRDTRTNTPLQALNLMNDVTFLEAARLLAERAMKEGGASPESRIARAFLLALARRPSPEEQRILLASLHHYLDLYQTDASAARKLLDHGEAPRDERLKPGELAAYTAVASLILNLDEMVTKE